MQVIKKGRPPKKKIVHDHPRIDNFTPEGRPELSDISIVALEEYEAIRLQDHLGMPQKQAAEMMGISQQTFSRIIRLARGKVSDAIVNAKTIRIEGGDFVSKRSMLITDKLKRKTIGEVPNENTRKFTERPSDSNA